MNYKAGQEYLKARTKRELVDAYTIEYLEWKKTGILPNGLIRTLYETLSDGDEYVNVNYAENMFNERLAELYYLEHSNNLSREEALQLMIDGVKVTHRYFTREEYIYMKGQNIFGEDGCNFGTVNDEFWMGKRVLGFMDGWKTYKKS